MEISLAAAAVLCQNEDPQRSILLVSEVLVRLERIITQQPEQCDAAIFKIAVSAFHNAALALAMLPGDNGPGSSTATGNSRRKSRAMSRARSSGEDARISPIELVQMALVLAAAAFGPDSALCRHLQHHAMSNVVQLHVLPSTVTPPRTRGALLPSLSPTPKLTIEKSQ